MSIKDELNGTIDFISTYWRWFMLVMAVIALIGIIAGWTRLTLLMLWIPMAFTTKAFFDQHAEEQAAVDAPSGTE